VAADKTGAALQEAGDKVRQTAADAKQKTGE